MDIIEYKHKCIVPGCTSIHFADPTKKSKNFFPFPNSFTFKKQWVNAINKAFLYNKVRPSTRHYVCQDHFTDECFASADKSELHKLAVPSVFNIPFFTKKSSNPNAAPLSTEVLWTSSEVSDKIRTAIIRRKMRLVYDLDRMQQNKIAKVRWKFAIKKTAKVEKLIKALSTKNIVRDIEIQWPTWGSIKPEFISALRENTNWTIDTKAFALALYRRQGPQTYNELRKHIKLPTKPTLDKYLNKIPFNPGTDLRYFQKIQTKAATMLVWDKACSLMFAEFPLRKKSDSFPLRGSHVGGVHGSKLGSGNNAPTRALVFMLQGLWSNWRQPVCYYLSRGPTKAKALSKLLRDVIIYVQSSGLDLVSTVCTHSPTNRKALKLVQRQCDVPINEPYLIINNKRMSIFYDTPQLMKSTRNMLLKYTIIHEETKRAKFEYLVKVYKTDKSHGYMGLLYKLRGAHLDVNILKRKSHIRNSVEIAAKTLSQRTAGTLSTYYRFSPYPEFKDNPEVMDTAHFVVNIDTLFDSLNSNDKRDTDDHTLRVCVERKSGHHAKWDELEKWIETWRFYDESTQNTRETLPFKEAWINNIKAVKLLWEKLYGLGFQRLGTRRLSLDPLRDLFLTINFYKFFKGRPTSKQFIAALKTILVNGATTMKDYYDEYENHDDDEYILETLQSSLKD